MKKKRNKTVWWLGVEEHSPLEGFYYPYPLYEEGRCLVGFLKGIDTAVINRLTHFLRVHDRKRQKLIVADIRDYIMDRLKFFTGNRKFDNEMDQIIAELDNYIVNVNKP
ncbi:MAG: hypothetical protein IJ588_11170 [Prevotella sp.]|nr:hypothetical protein [Prevotella sp.]